MALIRARFRPMMRLETVVLLVLVWTIATMNGSWWTAVGAGRSWRDPATWEFFAATFIALTALHFVLLAPWMNRWTLRPLLGALVVASAAAAYFTHTYSILLDPAMIRNVLSTDTREARELLSWNLAGAVLLWSVLPLAFIGWVRIERHRWPAATAFRIGSVAVGLAIGILAILPVNRDLTSLMRNHRELRYLIVPGNFIYGLAGSVAREARDARLPREPVGTDAHRLLPAARRKPRLFVLVVGETARAANFSLLGYDRATTPELAKLEPIAFRNVTACGTSTEVSVPCMFSSYGRAEYDERRIRHSEGLLDVLARAGYLVRWWDNQSGCKGVCQGAGIEYRKLDPGSAPDLCAGNECLDEILVRRLQADIAGIRADTVIVLHMLGNHGPAYYRRYPPQFRRFTPDCATAELRECSREQVVNAYDNAILYTDHVLAAVVRTLVDAPALDTAMLYVSDHGESLGERGVYLHGMPNWLAPSSQTHVPMIAWLSPGFPAGNSVDRGCLLGRANRAISHDNLFHSVLGLLDVQTRAYRPERDVFQDCRGAAGVKLVRNDAEPRRGS